MGSSESSLKADVEIGEEVPRTAAVYRIWTDVYPCLLSKRRKCTLFARNFAETDSKETRSFFENGIKIIRQLRHPYIAEYVDSSFNALEATLLLERVQMLDLAIDSLSPIEVHTGLTHILNALIFLHDKAGLSHNNICPSSIFVALDGRWKLGGFECAQTLENTRHWAQSDFVRSIRISEFSPPEDKLMLTVNIAPTARDAFAFGKLIFYALPFLRNCLVEETVCSLEAAAECLTDEDASKRGELGSLPVSYAAGFTNTLSAVVDFLQTIHLKTSHQKAEFFRSIVDELTVMPEDVVGKRLIPLLLSRYVVLEKGAHVKLLPFVLQPSRGDEARKGLLTEVRYRKFVIPQLLKIFRVHDTAVRLAILSHFPLFVRFFTIEELDNDILPELVLGMRDTDERIVSASLHAMANLVPFLGGPKVTGLVHSKNFADGAPKKIGIFTRNFDQPSPKHNLEPNSSPFSSVHDKSNDAAFSSSSPLSRILVDDEPFENPIVKLELLPETVDVAGNDEASANAYDDSWSAAWESDGVEFETSLPALRDSTLTCEPISLKSTDANAAVESGARTSPVAEKKNSEIGAEYEIPEIGKLVLKKDEFAEPDYFSDMEPVLNKAPSLHDHIKKGRTPNDYQRLIEVGSVVPSSKFAVIAEETSDVNDCGSWEIGAVADWDAD